ncbi:MAG: DnaT-like ssDNA-binding protein [Candidatus Paceibacterota bacterium]
MADLALVDTVGAEDANTYISVEDATAYFAYRLNCTEWTAASNDLKCQALFMACKIIDRLNFKYQRANPLYAESQELQALAFPRSGAPMHDRHVMYVLTDGVVEYIIPQDIKDAQCEQALALLKKSSVSALKKEGIASQSIGDVSITFAGDVSLETPQSRSLCSDAMAILRTWINTEVSIQRG